MSIQRGCQFCGKRLRGVVPGAMTIEQDGAPPDAAIVLCTEHAIEIRRVLDIMRQRSIVAQHARAIDVTQPQTRVSGAPTELFPIVEPNRTMADHVATLPPGTLRAAPDARLPVPLTREPERRPTSLLGWRRQRRDIL